MCYEPLFGPKGLDQESRDIIRDMVKHGAPDNDVRAKINRLCNSSYWDKDANNQFADELKSRGYDYTARHLRAKNSGSIFPLVT